MNKIYNISVSLSQLGSSFRSTSSTVNVINAVTASGYLTGPAGPNGAAGAGVPVGGTANQVLAKIDSTNYNTQWVNQTGGGTGDMLKATYDPASKNAQLAADSEVVKLTGAQTVAGVKTFSSAPVVPSNSFPESAITNLTTDLAAKQATLSLTTTGTSGAATLTGATLNIPNYATGGGGTGDMILASAQTVTGAKTFNAGKLLDKGEIVFDVKAYGAVGDGTTDDTTAIQNTIDACHTAGGGTVYFPAATYKITAALKLYSGTTPTITAYSNITLKGAGASSTGGTIVKQVTTGADCIKGLNDVANGAQSINNQIFDLCLIFGGATLTNSGNGIYLAQQAAGGPSFQQWNFRNVQAVNFQGSGKYGFNFESMITSTVDTCQALVCANGFYLNGAVSGAYSSVSTSVTFLNCYANMAANGVNGYRITDNTYISFIGCACDIGANMTGSGYLVEGSAAVSFHGCGCELNGTATLSNMWKFAADASANPSSQIGLYNCYGFQAKTTVLLYATGSSTGITIIGFQENSTVSGSTSLKTDAGSQVSELDCSFTSAKSNAGTDTIVGSSGGSGITRSVNSISANTTAGAVALKDYVYICTGSTGYTLTLPTAVGNTNRYTVKNGSTANQTLATTSAQTVDGSASATLTPNTSLDLISDGTNWRTI